MSGAITAQPTKIPCRVWIWVGPRNSVLVVGVVVHDIPGKGQFGGHLPARCDVRGISVMS